MININITQGFTTVISGLTHISLVLLLLELREGPADHLAFVVGLAGGGSLSQLQIWDPHPAVDTDIVLLACVCHSQSFL